MGFFTRLFGLSARENKLINKVSQSNGNVGLSTVGRRQREDVPYALPKDLEEGQRLNLQHYIFRYFLHGNYAVPLPETMAAILDIGSGTGIWGQEMAAQFPSARVFGLDLEPSQSVSLSAKVVQPPSNYHFVQGNLLDGLPFPSAMFDYTHQRMLSLAIPSSYWYKDILELVRVTRPGGWVELLEIGNGEIEPKGPATNKVTGWLEDALNARGLDMAMMGHLDDMLIGANLHSITTRTLDIPLGAWDSRLGVLMEKDLAAVFTILKPVTCARVGITPEQFDEYLQEAIREWKHMRSHCRFYLAYGQV